ncbi:hypothetical protein B0O99DRAFT_634200 [Bisporella sp. PMI_857]|nr:hypothetical protein B0O99DRAFT_634200 [Bisporella sp. PMI_857]
MLDCFPVCIRMIAWFVSSPSSSRAGMTLQTAFLILAHFFIYVWHSSVVSSGFESGMIRYLDVLVLVVFDSLFFERCLLGHLLLLVLRSIYQALNYGPFKKVIRSFAFECVLFVRSKCDILPVVSHEKPPVQRTVARVAQPQSPSIPFNAS